MSADFPTADDVAWAIVAGCRETGEDPIACDGRKMSIRGRHYALHALLHVFPELPRYRAAELVGCPGKPAAFWNNSWYQVIRPCGAGGALHMANWFDDEAYARVIAIVELSASDRRALPTRSLTIDFRRKPSTDYDDVTAAQMGDPAPGRSALDQRINR
jgi:hypothetical protein